MKTNYFINSFFLFAALLFLACNQEDNPEICTDVFCTSVVKSAKIDNQLNYSLHFYLRVFAPIKALNLTGPEGTFELTDDVDSQLGFYEYSKTIDFGKIEPSEGTWFYNILYANDQVKIIAANISKPYLVPVENINITTNNDGLINVSWNAIDNADYYHIKTEGSSFSTQIIQDEWNICTACFDRMEFSWGEPVDIIFEITAFHVKGNPEKITSVSSTIVNYHIDEFQGLW